MLYQRRRDSQKNSLYAWEHIAFAEGWKQNLTREQCVALVQRIHADVRAAGGFAAEHQTIKFLKRNGSACARWGVLNFSPKRLNVALVVHEVCHSLTWEPMLLCRAESRNQSGFDLSVVEKHALQCLDRVGHGPQYVAAYIAAMEKYAGVDVRATLASAKHFTTKRWIRTYSPKYDSLGNCLSRYDLKSVERNKHVDVNIPALDYWRDLLSGQTPLQQELAAAEAAAKQPKTRAPRPEGSAPVGKLDESAVISFVAPNPRKQGTASRERYTHYAPGQTLAQALAAGVWREDIRWDLKQGFIKLEQTQ